MPPEKLADLSHAGATGLSVYGDQPLGFVSTAEWFVFGAADFVRSVWLLRLARVAFLWFVGVWLGSRGVGGLWIDLGAGFSSLDKWHLGGLRLVNFAALTFALSYTLLPLLARVNASALAFLGGYSRAAASVSDGSAMKGLRSLLSVIVLSAFGAVVGAVIGAFHGGGTARAQALPLPPAIVGKPPYVALVRAMHEDEALLSLVLRQIETEKHAFRSECLTNLRPELLTATVAWAIEPTIGVQEVPEAIRFFESQAGLKVVAEAVLTSAETLDLQRFTKSPVGDKLLVKKVTRQPRVMLSVRAEVLDLLNICTDTLAGVRQIRYCESEWVRSSDQACSARYEVAGVSGDSARSTRVSLYCDFGGSNLSTLLTELPGSHGTVGLTWRANRTLEMVLPPSVTPRYRQTEDRRHGLKFESHTRTPADPPPSPCVPTVPIDEFGWPAR